MTPFKPLILLALLVFAVAAEFSFAAQMTLLNVACWVGLGLCSGILMVKDQDQ